MENTKQYALVTGGTSGIGYELAKILATNGHNLVLVARHEDDLNQVTGQLQTLNSNIDIVTMPKDLFLVENAFELYEDIRERNLDIGILVNDAGQGQYGKFIDTNIQRELDIINLNISSVVVLTKFFVKDMLARGGGRIMNLSSIASKMPGPWQSVYHATKAFIQSFTEAIGSELEGSGVTVTALLPGATATDFLNKADMQDSKIVQEGSLDDAAKVARDGYDAMMRGDDMVVSGFRNKAQVAMSSVTPDHALADKLNKKQAPVGSDQKSSKEKV